MELIIGRRAALGLTGWVMITGCAGAVESDPIYIRISGANTGADSAKSFATWNGAMLAIEEANEKE